MTGSYTFFDTLFFNLKLLCAIKNYELLFFVVNNTTLIILKEVSYIQKLRINIELNPFKNNIKTALQT